MAVVSSRRSPAIPAFSIPAGRVLPVALACLLASICLSPVPAAAQQTTDRFRGPDATGVIPDDPRLPTQWNVKDNVQWSVEVPGQGWGSPIVVGDRVFLSSVVADEKNLQPQKGLYLGKGVRDPAKGIHHWMVYCFELGTGKELWRQEAKTGRPVVPRHPKSSYAAETPTTDGERLYVLFGDVGLYCYSLEGKLLWSRDFDPQKTNMDYGAAASPVVHEGQVIVVYDNLEDSWIASFDSKTGEELWKTSRDETHSWATPFVWENDQRTEIVVTGQRKNRSYSLAGELLWEFDGDMSVLVIPSPFAAHGFCYLSSGYVGDSHRPTFAVRPGASGDITPDGDFADSEFIAWYQPKASPYNTSQIVYKDYLYTVYDQGFMTCHNARTGEQVYGKKRFSPAGSFTASPIAYDDKLFCLSEDGLTYVVQAGPEFKLLHANPLDELCIATPAAADGKLLVRTLTRLYCISGNTPVTSKGPVSDPSTDLLDGCVRGDLAKVRESLERGADLKTRGLQGATALHTAAFFAHPEIVSLLIQKGADRDAKDDLGRTPLEIVSATWDARLIGFYNRVDEMLGLELDLKRIEQEREGIASQLKAEQGSQAD